MNGRFFLDLKDVNVKNSQHYPQRSEVRPNLNLNLYALLVEKTLRIMLNWQEGYFLFKVKIKAGSETYSSIL